MEKPEKDIRFLKSWRPISLINVDTKICSKALSIRLAKVLPSLISEDQAAFVKGRLIEEPIRIIDDIMFYARQNKLESLMFAIDFERAFDSVEHNFIFATLRKFGFGPIFIQWIRTILSDNSSCDMNNGSSTHYFKLRRGTKQGDPISPQIFILVIEKFLFF